MRRGRVWGAAAVAAGCAVLFPGGAAGQQDALDGATGTDGWNVFEVATRDDVLVCDWGINRGRSWRWRDEGQDRDCVEGSIEVMLRVRDGRVAEVEHRPPGSLRGPEADADLGRVGTAEAARFLLDLVPGSGEEVGEDALGVAALIDSVTIWPDLERLATDRTLEEDVRESALFWLGQEAAEEATRTLTQVLDTPDESVDIKEAAVFALSQRPADVAIPLLLDVARTAPHPEVRESAFFWLSQFDDPRVLRFFREVLTGPE